MSEQFADFESAAQAALAPVEPPEELEARLEGTLGSLVELAADELEAWELSAMRDPRNWVAPGRRRRRSARAPRSGSSLVRTQRQPAQAPAQARGAVDLAGPHAARRRARGQARRRRRLLIRPIAGAA